MPAISSSPGATGEVSTIRGRIHIKQLFIGGFVKPPNTDAYTEGTASSWSLTANGGGSGSASDDSSTGNFKKGEKHQRLVQRRVLRPRVPELQFGRKSW